MRIQPIFGGMRGFPARLSGTHPFYIFSHLLILVLLTPLYIFLSPEHKKKKGKRRKSKIAQVPNFFALNCKFFLLLFSLRSCFPLCLCVPIMLDLIDGACEEKNMYAMLCYPEYIFFSQERPPSFWYTRSCAPQNIKCSTLWQHRISYFFCLVHVI